MLKESSVVSPNLSHYNQFNMTKVLIGGAVILSLSLGFAIGKRFSLPTPEPATLVERECDDRQIKNKLNQLTENELKAIADMSEGPERSRRIENLLGQIVQLFIIDLGLRLHPVTAEDKKVVHEPPLAADHPPLAPPTELPKAELKKKFLVSIANGHDEREIKSSLDKITRENLYDDMKSAVPINQDQIRSLLGKWQGTIEHTDSREIEGLTLSLEQIENRQRYKYTTIKKGSQGTSRSNGTGDLKDWESLDGEVFIAIGTGYLSLVYNSSLDEWFGTYYKEISKSKHNAIGLINLKRER